MKQGEGAGFDVGGQMGSDGDWVTESDLESRQIWGLWK